MTNSSLSTQASTSNETTPANEANSTTAKLWQKVKPIAGNFVTNLPQNLFFAAATTPAERLALCKITFAMENPLLKPPGYRESISSLKLSGLSQGLTRRSTYCLAGNFSTMIGMSFFGRGIDGLLITALFKNAIYPVFLWSNGKQLNYSAEQIRASILKGMRDPAGHTSFFARNLAANYCTAPGLWVADHTYHLFGSEGETLPRFLGLTTSLFFSTFMNAFLKPLFTDPKKYSFDMRWQAAKRFPGLGALCLREFASLCLIFSNNPLTKAKQEEPKENNDAVNQPKLK
jgi:hypothetical protein